MYQYKNISYFGIILFLIFAVINQFFTIMNYRSFIYVVQRIVGLCSSFSMILLPVAFVVSVLVTISNIVLVRKEGISKERRNKLEKLIRRIPWNFFLFCYNFSRNIK